LLICAILRHETFFELLETEERLSHAGE
jgi:hypothetical protein